MRGAWLVFLGIVSTTSCSGREPRGGAAEERGARPALHVVTVRGVRFDPESLVVGVGDSVRWENRDLVPHTSTAEGGAWSSPAIPADSSWSATIRSPGRHAYFCAFHTNMRGMIVAR